MLHTLFGKREEVNYKELVKDGAIIVDVRSREEYSIDHVKGSVNIPLDILPVSLDKLGGKNKCIIACCASGNRSGIAKNALESLGYTNVHNGGGWHSLQKKLS
jgi:rhodanese-related sulfurtransferase